MPTTDKMSVNDRLRKDLPERGSYDSWNNGRNRRRHGTEKNEAIIEALRHERYQWKPVWLFQKIA